MIFEVKEAFFRMEDAAKSMGLVINEHKTKLIVVSVTDNMIRRIGQNITIGDYNFKVVRVCVPRYFSEQLQQHIGRN